MPKSEKIKKLEEKMPELLKKGLTEKQIEEFKQEILSSEITPWSTEVLSSDDIRTKNIPQSEFIVEKLIPKGCITMLSGNPGANKSWIALQICKEIGCENPLLFERFIIESKAKILYIDEETSYSEIKRRWMKLSPPPVTFVDFMAMSGFKIDNSDQRKEVLDFCFHRSYNLIVIDALRDVFGGNENDSTVIQNIIDCLKDFTRNGISVFLIHHNRKESPLMSNSATQALRGSSAILGGIDSLITIEKATRMIQNNSIELIISQSKLRQGLATKNFKLRMEESDEELITFKYLEEMDSEETKLSKVKDDITGFLANEIEASRKVIMDEMLSSGHTEATVRRTFKEMEINGNLIVSGGHGKSKNYKLKDSLEQKFIKV